MTGFQSFPCENGRSLRVQLLGANWRFRRAIRLLATRTSSSGSRNHHERHDAERAPDIEAVPCPWPEKFGKLFQYIATSPPSQGRRAPSPCRLAFEHDRRTRIRATAMAYIQQASAQSSMPQSITVAIDDLAN